LLGAAVFGGALLVGLGPDLLRLVHFLRGTDLRLGGLLGLLPGARCRPGRGLPGWGVALLLGCFLLARWRSPGLLFRRRTPGLLWRCTVRGEGLRVLAGPVDGLGLVVLLLRVAGRRALMTGVPLRRVARLPAALRRVRLLAVGLLLAVLGLTVGLLLAVLGLTVGLLLAVLGLAVGLLAVPGLGVALRAVAVVPVPVPLGPRGAGGRRGVRAVLLAVAR